MFRVFCLLLPSRSTVRSQQERHARARAHTRKHTHTHSYTNAHITHTHPHKYTQAQVHAHQNEHVTNLKGRKHFLSSVFNRLQFKIYVPKFWLKYWTLDSSYFYFTNNTSGIHVACI